MPGDDLPAQRAEQLHIRHIEIGVGDRFDHEADRLARQAEPAMTLREVGANQAEPAHLAHQRAVHRPFALAALIMRREFFAREAFGD